MADGSTLYAVKAALVTQLALRAGLSGVSISHQAPTKATDLKTTTGDFDAIWLGDADDDTNVVVFSGLPLRLDESYELDLIVQVLRPTTEGTQAVCDARASSLLGEVFGLLASNPTLGLADGSGSPDFPRCEVVPTGWRNITGPLPAGVGFGSRFEVRLGVEGRLSLS